MTPPLANPVPAPSPGEEIANTLSHGAGLLLALIAVPVLIISATPAGGAAVTGAAVFGITAVIVYGLSTLYHAVSNPRAKNVLQVLDHAAIFLLIAGTYTPFTLGVLRGPWGWTLFGLVWTLGLIGVLLKLMRGARHPRLSLCLYLATGWIALVAARPLWLSVPGWGLFWIVAGGVMYTAGVLFFLAEHRRFNHFVWHLFVMGGTACHFVAVLNYAVVP